MERLGFSIEENATGWGPTGTFREFPEKKFSLFGKAEKLGISDFVTPAGTFSVSFSFWLTVGFRASNAMVKMPGF